jgi:4-methyl-5(b-hydroxyethyl)-thiazole monophosphate biosynthesis
MKKRALFLFADGVEELELIAPVDVLRRAGVEVIMATVGEGIHVQSRGNLKFHADCHFADVSIRDFDMLVLPGGPGVIALRRQGFLAEVLREFFAIGRPIAAICAAPLLLYDAGILAGRRYTSHDSCWGELVDSVSQEAVVCDGGIITSRGAGTALEFGLTLVGILCGNAVRRRVEGDIML